jgi:uncharacterized protein YgiM (DUF1202 family)
MKVLLILLISAGVWADSAALFGLVTNVTKNDTLNVRSDANYNSKKVGALPFDAGVGIEKCKIVKNSTWCRIYPLVQNSYDTFGPQNTGWVNTRYLTFSYRGYVNVTGEDTNCFYAVKCRDIENKKECLVVYDLKYDYEKDTMTEIKSKWIERKKLKGESAFGAASQNVEINPEGGYCTNARMIEDYFEKINKVLFRIL